MFGSDLKQVVELAKIWSIASMDGNGIFVLAFRCT
jgi:hypothetical protein